MAWRAIDINVRNDVTTKIATDWREGSNVSSVRKVLHAGKQSVAYKAGHTILNSIVAGMCGLRRYSQDVVTALWYDLGFENIEHSRRSLVN